MKKHSAAPDLHVISPGFTGIMVLIVSRLHVRGGDVYETIYDSSGSSL